MNKLRLHGAAHLHNFIARHKPGHVNAVRVQISMRAAARKF